jgi:sugar lactone lactonase YvrE
MGGAIQGTPLVLAGNVSNLAGWTSSGTQDGTGPAARFSGPSGVAQDGVNLFVADTYAHTIRKVAIATGAVTTVAGTAGITGATDCTVGSGAMFNGPAGIATDGMNLYVADNGNSTIRKIVIATGSVTTVAGTAGITGATDCTVGSGATFNWPWGMTTDGANLYVADSGNSTIRRIAIATGAVTTVAGTAGITGATDCTVGFGATFNGPCGITTDGANLYVADWGNSTIRRIAIATGAVTTVAGTAGNPGSGDGTGTTAGFRAPSGISTDGINLYVADSANSTIRKIAVATGAVTTIAGTAGSSPGSIDGNGESARFYYPRGVTMDATNLFVADLANNNIRKIALTTGDVTTVAGIAPDQTGRDGSGIAATFFDPVGLTTDGSSLYAADIQNNTIRKIVVATGEVTTLAGIVGTWGSNDGIGTQARFDYPGGITTDGMSLYVSDTYNCTIRKIAIATGTVTTLAGTAGISGATDCTVGSGATFNFPFGLTTDGTYAYVADTGNFTIRKVALATGAVTTLAGSAGNPGSNDGAGATARFRRPQGITTDGTCIYVVDVDNRMIRKIVIATGVVTTVATGTSSWPIGDFLSWPVSVTTDGSSLFVGDGGVQSVRKIN